MLSLLENINPIIGALLATLFTWAVTALGASIVFFFKKVNKNIRKTVHLYLLYIPSN